MEEYHISMYPCSLNTGR